MKTKKIVALMLSLAMVLGVVAACSSDEEPTTPDAPAATDSEPAATDDAEPAETDDAEPAETETADPVVDESAYAQPEVASDVTDESDKVLIYGWNEEFPGLVDTYSSIQYDLEITESNTYQTKLDQVLASGEDAPDIFVCDADYATKYMKNDDVTIPVADLGIANSELTEMYNYTLQFATNDANVIKGIAWQACPCGVFYNRSVAAATLGVSEPDEVAPFFATWEAFLETARTVDSASNGEMKAVSGTDDIWRSYLNTRSQGWIVDGEVYVDPVMQEYFDLAKTLKDEGLTFETSQWGDAWTANMENGSTLSYWGPMWLARFSMGLDTTSGGANPTSGDWGLVNAPGSFFWGGTWMMASSYCDMKASVAQIMRDIAIDTDNLTTMAQGGEFVNNLSIMTAAASDSAYDIAWLGGQNPFAVLLASASTIDNSIVGQNDQAINDEFANAVNSYLAGDIATVAEAEDAFVAAIEELGIV